MAVGVQWLWLPPVEGKGEPHFCSKRHWADKTKKNLSAHGLFQAGLSLSRSGVLEDPPAFPCSLPPKAESRRPVQPKPPEAEALTPKEARKHPLEKKIFIIPMMGITTTLQEGSSGRCWDLRCFSHRSLGGRSSRDPASPKPG